MTELFKLARPLAEDEILKGVRQALDDRKDNVIAGDEKDGWSAVKVGDSKNDFPGDVMGKRVDNMFFLYAKALPGKATDAFRDFLSPRHTSRIRNSIAENENENVLRKEIADKVADAIYAEAEALVRL